MAVRYFYCLRCTKTSHSVIWYWNHTHGGKHYARAART